MRMQIDGRTIASASVSFDVQSHRVLFFLSRVLVTVMWCKISEYNLGNFHSTFWTIHSGPEPKSLKNVQYIKTVLKQECLSALCRIFFMNDISGIIDYMSYTNQSADTELYWVIISKKSKSVRISGKHFGFEIFKGSFIIDWKRKRNNFSL